MKFNEKTIEQLNGENLCNVINKRLINIIMNKMKNGGNRNELTNEQNISETVVSQFLKCVMDSIPILLEDKNKCYALQTRSQLKNLTNINMHINEDTMKSKLLKNVEVINKVQNKCGRPRKIIQEVKLQKSI